MKILNNLFSIFDPSSSFLNLNWLMIFFPLITFLFILNSKWFSMIKKMNFSIKKEMIQTNMKFKNSDIIFLFLWFSLIMWYNLTGLISFSFTLTAQIVFSVSMALSIWMSFFSKNWMKNFKKTLSHLVPSGSPNLLMPILILIELISNLIRPITLSVRLSANMMAGHLLMSLLGEASSLNFFPLTSFSMLLLIILESAVALIQAYVFTILITIYSSEI